MRVGVEDKTLKNPLYGSAISSSYRRKRHFSQSKVPSAFHDPNDRISLTNHLLPVASFIRFLLQVIVAINVEFTQPLNASVINMVGGSIYLDHLLIIKESLICLFLPPKKGGPDEI